MSDRFRLSQSYLRKIVASSPLETLEIPNFEHLSLSDEDRSLAAEAYRKAQIGSDLSSREQFALEAIIIPDKRPAIDIVHGDYGNVDHPDWLLLNKETPKAKLRKCFVSIGRVEVQGFPGLPFGGTGFLVGNGLLMTNRHVAELFASGLGEKDLNFKIGRSSSIDLACDPDQTEASRQLHVRGIRLVHPYWDMAILEVDGDLYDHAPLALSPKSDSDFEGHNVALIGYPAFDLRNPADVQQRVFGGRYNVKRLLPGIARERRMIQSFGNNVNALTHDASSLGGSSGSAVVDLGRSDDQDSAGVGSVIGLHFAGVYLDANFAVPSWELARDTRIVDAGVVFAEVPEPDQPTTQLWWRAISSEAPGTVRGAATKPETRDVSPVQVSTPISTASSNGSTTLTIPIEITVRVGAPRIETQRHLRVGREMTVATGPSDQDPAAPAMGELSERLSLEEAQTLANLGLNRKLDVTSPTPEAPALGSLLIKIDKAKSFLHACVSSSPRVGYGLGAKVPFHGAIPGLDFTKVDCSGFIRELVWRSTDIHPAFPDGSVNQHDWVRAQVFARSNVEDAMATDGVVRIAFLRPGDTTSGIGHVVIVYNGATMESHGGVGPDSRPWTGSGWQKVAFVYMMSPPPQPNA